MKIEWLISGVAPHWVEANYENGGYVYDTFARTALREEHAMDVTYLTRGNSSNRAGRLLQFCAYLIRSMRLHLRGDVVIRDLFSTVFAPYSRRCRHVVIIHHLDSSGFGSRWVYRVFSRLFFWRVRKADVVVAVSRFWSERLRQAGCRRVETIYNSFELERFRFSEEELEKFRLRCGFDVGMPLVYLGHASSIKGFAEAFRRLQGIGAHFVVTGKKKIDLPLTQLFLSYGDYLKLLKISTIVVTMSQFDEGWCRTAHEAMLCGTPVIGSGRGGMRELLEGGEQLICSDFNSLPAAVGKLLENPDARLEMGEKGKAFASRFHLGYFRQSWLDIMKSIG